MRVLTIAAVELRRFFADRSNLFFVFIFPLAMVAVIGWQFGGDGPTSQVSVVAPEGSAHDALVSRWQEADLEVLVRDDAATLREDVARGDSDVGVVIPEASAQAYLDGAAMELEIVQGTSSQAPAVAEVVRAQAEEEGLADIFIEAGFEWRLAGCSMCLAMNPDQLAPEERCASTSNRNFEGRQGFRGRTHLMSPGMAAAAAITGRLTDVRDLA